MFRSYDLAVIGEGISGLHCASRAALGGLGVATFEANIFGGLVLNINELEGYPSDQQEQVSGVDLASRLMQSSLDSGVTSIQEEVTAIRARGGVFELVTAGGTAGFHTARQVVFASGAKLKKLGIPGEDEFEGRGVSYCADCDGPIFQGKDVVVIGGGDSALQEALVLSNFCRTVRVLCRGDRFRARPGFVERVTANPRITVLWKASPVAILGGETVEKVRIQSANDGGMQELACAAVFAYVGLTPNVGFAPTGISRNEFGCLVADENGETSAAGIWVIGAARAGYSGLLRDAMLDAERVADNARIRLKSRPVATL